MPRRGVCLSISPGNPAPQIWDAALDQLLLRVSRQNYDTWLRDTAGLRFEGTTLVVGAPNQLAADWLSTRMRTVIMQAINAVAGPGLKLRFEARQEQPAPGLPALQPSMLPGQAAPLNPRFTFASFLEADFNRLALTAAHDIVLNEQTTYSPLFITGESGSGKTHLLHAIAHKAAGQPIACVLVNAERFLSEFTTSLQTRTTAAFRARYHDLDLLVVDDVQILLGKKATQAEFYRTIASLHDQGRRVVVAGDKSALISAAAKRFTSQLQWGLVVTIETPSTADRARFITAKAQQQGLSLASEVVHYLALRARSSVRDLEGAVNRVAALSRIAHGPVTIEFAADALQPVAAEPPDTRSMINPETLLKITAHHLGLTPEDLTSQKRDQDTTYARHIAMYILRRDGGFTFAAIAQIVGRKDHSSVVHACSKLERQLTASPTLRADIDSIRAALHLPGTAA